MLLVVTRKSHFNFKLKLPVWSRLAIPLHESLRDLESLLTDTRARSVGPSPSAKLRVCSEFKLAAGLATAASCFVFVLV